MKIKERIEYMNYENQVLKITESSFSQARSNTWTSRQVAGMSYAAIVLFSFAMSTWRGTEKDGPISFLLCRVSPFFSIYEP